MENYIASLLFCLITLCFSVSSSPTLVLNLIHSNQIYSVEPPNAYGTEKASVARLDYLQSKATGDIITHIAPYKNTPSFMANISIGSPPVAQLLHIDTGSDLLWLQCRPCTNCYPQSLPIFDPSRSYTHRKESCQTSLNSMPTLISDAITGSCQYNMKYIDNTGSRGTLAKETLTFNTIYDESSSASLPNVVFGCGHDNYGEPLVGTGILGLGYGKLSLVRRFGSKFSYCFGSLYDSSYSHNVLLIGDDGAKILGDTTPLEIENGLYYVKIEAISVDGIILPIEPSVFQPSSQTRLSGTIIDTGTSLTSLVREAYEPLKNKVEDIFDGRFKTAYPRQGEIMQMECYSGDFERDLVASGFPIVTLHFSDGAELSLDVKSVFTKVEPGIFCLAVTPSIGGNLNIIGAMAQQNHNVGYDLEANKISFERIDCGIIFDY